MRDRMRSDLTRAMKARDQIQVSVLRSGLAAIDNAEAVEITDKSDVTIGDVTIGYGDVARRSLTGQQIANVLQDEIGERQVSVIEYERIGRPDLAETLRREIEILRSYLETA
ncbi:MAG: GatB/YqeY domain-containing protein [Actinomycetota bacterium]|nr:GatB/YqeY domain-containing protein [Actinomycetota bacterium]